jgi:hypothetical protein
VQHGSDSLDFLDHIQAAWSHIRGYPKYLRILLGN